MSEPRGADGRWRRSQKRTLIVQIRMNDDDMKRIAELISSGIGETPSEVIRYAIQNCANDGQVSKS